MRFRDFLLSFLVELLDSQEVGFLFVSVFVCSWYSMFFANLIINVVKSKKMTTIRFWICFQPYFADCLFYPAVVDGGGKWVLIGEYRKGNKSPRISMAILKSLPIPNVDFAMQVPIISIVNEILAAKKANPSADTSIQEAEIDRLVYDLYDVPQEERK